jgi:hypothetical protein
MPKLVEHSFTKYRVNRVVIVLDVTLNRVFIKLVLVKVEVLDEDI